MVGKSCENWHSLSLVERPIWPPRRAANIFEDTSLNAIHANRVTIMHKDIQLAVTYLAFQ
jgi:hypothetical protein